MMSASCRFFFFCIDGIVIQIFVTLKPLKKDKKLALT